MQHFHILRAGALSLAILALASCDEGTASGSNGFQNQYFAARGALEAGKYDRANRSYAQLLTRAGPLAPRIRLEYSHSLLRSGDYTAAAREARVLSDTLSSTDRNAALSVQATADHELALVAIQSGDFSTGELLLRQADAAITEVLANDPELDPLGALAGRQASIRVRLKSLG